MNTTRQTGRIPKPWCAWHVTHKSFPACFLTGETLLSSRVPEIPEIDNESAGNEYGPVSLSGAP